MISARWGLGAAQYASYSAWRRSCCAVLAIVGESSMHPHMASCSTYFAVDGCVVGARSKVGVAMSWSPWWAAAAASVSTLETRAEMRGRARRGLGLGGGG